MSYEIYKASCENVKRLKREAKLLNKLLNNAIKYNCNQDIETLTPILALVYSSYAEISFIKMINTPYGFEDSYIQEIMSQRNLEQKWEKCFELVFDRIENNINKGEISNKRKQISEYFNKYILEPSQIRNKIAHGQWSVCFNNNCTRINEDLTNKIQNLDCVQIYRLFEIYEKFSCCIEDLIESPNRAHYRFFYNKISDLESYINKTQDYSLETKRKQLQSSSKYRKK